MSDEPTNAELSEVSDPPAESIEQEFAEALKGVDMGWGLPDGKEGQSEPTEAVETSADKDTPEADETEKVEPDAKSDDAPAEPVDEPETKQTVNFDGFESELRATWEKLVKDGVVTHEFAQANAERGLRWADYTKKTMAVSDEKKAMASQAEQDKEDLDLIRRIRGDDHLHDLWMRMQRGDVPSKPVDGEDSDASELVERAEAERIAREQAEQILKRRDEERRERTQKQQDEYVNHARAVQKALLDTMDEDGIKKEVLAGYMKTLENAVPDGSDPILYYDPKDIPGKIRSLHREATLRARVEELEQRLGERTSKAERTSKQSSEPSLRTVPVKDTSLMGRVNEELGLDQDWSNVTGFGNPQGHP